MPCIITYKGKRYEETEFRRKLVRGGLTELSSSYLDTTGWLNESVRIVDQNYLYYLTGRQAWGAYKDGIIYVATNKEGNIRSGILHHEIFHKIYNEYLSPQERIALRGEIRSSNLDVEEALARAYQANSVGLLNSKSVLGIVARYIYFSFKQLSALEAYFASLRQGSVAYRKPEVYTGERYLEIRNMFGTYENFDIARTIFSNSVNEKLNDAREDPNEKIYSIDEASIATINEIAEELKVTQERIKAEVTTDEEKKQLGEQAKLYSAIVKNAKEFATYVLSEAATPSIHKLSKIEKLEKKKQSMDLTEVDELAKLEAELVNLKNELEDSLREDPDTNITGRIKQRLSTLQYIRRATTDAEGKLKLIRESVNFKEAYNFLYDEMRLLPMDSIENYTTEALDRLRPHTRRGDVALTPKQAVADWLFNLVKTAGKRKTTPSPIFFAKRFSARPYVVVSLNGKPIDTEKVKSYSDVEAFNKDNPNDFTLSVIEQELTETLDQFVNRVNAATDNSVSRAQIIDAYYLFEDLTVLKSISVAVGSLGQYKLGVIKSKRLDGSSGKWTKDNNSTRLSVAVRGSSSRSLNSQISTELIDRVEAFEKDGVFDVNKLFSKELVNLILDPISRSTEEKRNILSKVLDNFKRSPSKLKLINKSAVDDLFGTLVETIKKLSAKEDGALIADIKEGVWSLSSIIESVTPGEVIANTTWDANRNKLFFFTKASFERWMLEQFSNKEEGRGAARRRKKLIKAAHINVQEDGSFKSEVPYLVDNIFSSEGKNKALSHIYNFIDFDAISFPGSNRSPIPYSKENKGRAFQRKFIAGFVAFASIKNESIAAPMRYAMTMMQPSGRMRTRAAVVDIIPDNKFVEVVNRIQAAEKARNSMAFTKNANFEKNRGSKKSLFDALGTSDPNEIVEKLKEKAREYYKTVTQSEDVDFITNLADIQNFYEMMGVKKELPIIRSKKEIAEQAEKAGLSQTQAEELNVSENERSRIKQLVYDYAEDAYVSFYLNETLQLGQLNDVFYGSRFFFKNLEDLIKRIQVITASGSIPNLAMSSLARTSRIAIVDEPKALQEAINPDNPVRKIDIADGEGYITEEYYEKLADAHSFESNLDVTLKPVLYQIDENGQPLALKYALIVLTKEMLADPKFEGLKIMRESMRAKDIDMLVFKSAVKVGLPEDKDLTKLTRKKRESDGYEMDVVDNILESSVRVIDNGMLRMQLNPSADVNARVSNPSQGTYLANVTGESAEDADRILELNSTMVNLGVESTKVEMAISDNGKTTRDTQNRLRKALEDNMRSGTIEKELLTAKQGEGRKETYSIDLNLPLLTKKVVENLTSLVRRNTIGFTFPGSKLVLQSSFGISYNGRSLRYKDENNFTEVIMPEEYRGMFNEGDVLTNMVGIRIPSTHLHSLVALKIVGFYPTPKGAKGNVVIAPADMISAMGSDKYQCPIKTLLIAGNSF